ncbi:MAG: hypothetical protein IJO58_06170 [Clostridia bacterium]|nr:hypothetical protein [Clostridia bacterium]
MEKKCEWIFDRYDAGERLLVQCTRLDAPCKFSLEGLNLKEALMLIFSRTMDNALCITNHVKLKVSLTIAE